MKKSIIVACCLWAVLFSTPAWALITITGVANKTIYPDTVSFVVQSEAGFEYAAALNGIHVAVGAAVKVDVPEYYELAVSRKSIPGGTEETALVQFIVRATERRDTEWGLPVWTPYPAMKSAAAEYVGAQLDIVTPAAYPLGLEIPVIARVHNAAGKRLGVNGHVQAVGFDSHPLQVLRGVGSVFLPPAAAPGVLSYDAQIQSLSLPKQIVIEPSTTWQTVSGTIVAATEWGPDARVRITDTLTVAPGAVLTVGQGSVILVDPDVEINVQGTVIVLGTAERPVVFTAQNRSVPWGGFLFESAASRGEFSYTIFTASGADENWFGNNPGHGSAHHSDQCLFYLSNNAHVELTQCAVVENHGQLGHGENGFLTLTNSLVQKCITGGQYNGGSLVADNSALIEFPLASAPFADADNDALYLSGGAHYLTDSLLGWTLDDGIDAGQGAEGSLAVTGCWFESCFHEAMALSSGPRHAQIVNTVVLNCGQAIECGYDTPLIDADNCLLTANAIGARFGDNYARAFNGFLDVQNSLLLFNIRDVWGVAWDNWQWHHSQMNVRSNYLSVSNVNHTDNLLWDPQGDPAQAALLEPFLPVDSDIVGIGLAVPRDSRDISLLETDIKIPVRLSAFTTVPVSAAYAIYADSGLLYGDTLTFVPGQTLRHIEFVLPSTEGIRKLRVVLSDPVNAELTGYSQLLYQKPYEIVQPLAAVGDMWRYFKGTSEPPADWNLPGFADAAWLSGPSGFGYETSSGYEACLATNLTDMKGSYYSVYARRLFEVDDPTRVTKLTLTMEWDDGYIAYLNGMPVDSQNPPSPVAYNRPASSDSHEACCGAGCAPRQVDLSSFIDLLQEGENVLAVQAHNATLSSSDFLFIPTLTSVSKPRTGDFEPDGDVDLADFAVFAQAWLSEDGQSQYNPVCDLDSTADGAIDLRDIEIFLQNWLSGGK